MKKKKRISSCANSKGLLKTELLWVIALAILLPATLVGAKVIEIGNIGDTIRIMGQTGTDAQPPAYSQMQIVGTTSKEALRIVTSDYSPLNIRNSANNSDIYRVDQTGTLAVGSVPWARLSDYPTACSNGQFVTGVGGTLTCSAPTSATQWTTNGSHIYYNSGYIGVGTTSPIAVIHSFATSTANYISERISSDTLGPQFLYKKSRGVFGAQTAVTAGDVILHITGQGYDGSAYQSGASFRAFAEENWSTGARGSYLAFHTTANGGTTLTERMRINNAGNVGIGTTTPVKKLVVNGDIAISGSGIIGQGHDYGTPVNTYNGTLELYNGSTGNTTLQSATAYNLLLNPGGGNVGIGTSSPLAALSVVGSGIFSQPVTLATPLTGAHAATKDYVDAAVAGASGGPVYYGMTTATYTGNLGGLSGAAAKCQIDFPAGARMCTNRDSEYGIEINSSGARGFVLMDFSHSATIGSSYGVNAIFGGSYASYNNVGCTGFTSSSGSLYNVTWNGSALQMSMCSGAYQIHCCGGGM